MSCKVFIASSSRAVPLAKWLAKELDKKNITARPWFDVAKGGHYVLQDLTEQAGECDFAAVLLTKDDILAKGSSEAEPGPRDNCIFEAGLFTGALGRDPGRCFLFVSVDEKALPSDLKGLVYYKIKDEPEGLVEQAKEDYDKPLSPDFSKSCKRVFGSNPKKMIKCMSDKGPYRRSRLQALTSEELLALERVGGKLTQTSTVLVSSGEPIERGSEFADRVLTNLNNSVKYTYFFSISCNEDIVAMVIQALAAGQLKTEDINARQRLMALPTNIRQIRKNIKVLKEGLRIYFVQDSLMFNFCIHNVGDWANASCYLRDNKKPPRFIEWQTGDPVKPIVEEIRKPILESNDEQIFQPANGLDFTFKREKLLRAVLKLFPRKLKSDIEKACFSTSTSAAASSKSAAR